MVRLLAVLLTVFFAGCASLQTESELPAAAEFSNLETFAWFDGEFLAGDEVRASDEKIRATVQDAIEQALIAKGYRKVDAGQADFVVSWFGAIERKILEDQLNHLYSPYGYGTLLRDPALNSEPSRAVGEYEEGTLIIDLLDRADRRLLWRGTGIGRVDRGRPAETALKNLAQAVTRILEPVPSR